MSNKKILIAYGTRFGSTKEVSEKLATLFEKAGCKTLVSNLNTTPRDQWPSLKDFDGVLVGSSIKRGQWTREPVKFLEENKKNFSSKKLLGIFICCATAALPEKRPQARERFINPVLNELDIRADMIDAFGGVIDLSKSSTMNWIDKKIVKKIHKNDSWVENNKRNDLRDWNQIKVFGQEFAQLVRNIT
jgi:menaquinone-dependent protoporphyrinogen oxidase